MTDKENLPVNLWYSQDNDPKMEAKKHVAFRLSEGDALKQEDRKAIRSDDDHSTNVTPGNQTSELLMGKMRELRERLEKLKSKGRKSGGDGVEGTASEEGKQNDSTEGETNTSRHGSPSAHLSPETPTTPLSSLPPSNTSPPAVTSTKPSSAPSSASSARTKLKSKLPSPKVATTLGSNVTATRKKPASRVPGPGSLLSKPPQRVTIDEARAQEEQAALEAPADVFRAPASKREATRGPAKVEVVKPDLSTTRDVVEAARVSNKDGSDEVSLESVARKRRSREVKTATQQLEESREETTGRREQQSESYAPATEIVTLTTDTSSTKPNTITATNMPSSFMVEVPTNSHTSDKKPEFRSPITKRSAREEETVERDTHPTSETQRQTEREASERTREQDRPRMDTSVTDSGAEQLAQEKANILALACQRGALEFLQGFATGETSFLTVNRRRYMKLNQIGRGGSSKVYRVVSPNWTTYALKYVPISDADSGTAEGYLNEISLLKKLKHHDNIIQLVDYEVKSGGIFLLLEYAELDLDKMLKTQQHRNKTIMAQSEQEGGPPRPSNLLPSLVYLNTVRLVWQQMLEAVHTIHEERVVHGDLKPANFVCIQGRLKLIDFGIAKAISNDTTNIVRDSQIGTINYISPEALIGDSSVQGAKYKLGRASDIWSLGCILYQMVYGRSPFAIYDNVFRKAQAITNPNHKIDYPAIDNPPLLDTMKLCLQFDPRQRPTIPELLRHKFLQ